MHGSAKFPVIERFRIFEMMRANVRARQYPENAYVSGSMPPDRPLNTGKITGNDLAHNSGITEEFPGRQQRNYQRPNPPLIELIMSQTERHDLWNTSAAPWCGGSRLNPTDS
jgi:hypothetical protein